MRIVSNLCLITLFSLTAIAQKTVTGDESFGDWYGESKCVSGDPNCRDEVVVYNLTRARTDGNKFNISRNKIVNGKTDFMGDSDFVFDAKKMTLTAEIPFLRI